MTVRVDPSAAVQSVTITDMRSVPLEILHHIQDGALDAVPVVVNRWGEPMAVLVSVELFNHFRSLQRAADITAGTAPAHPTDDGHHVGDGDAGAQHRPSAATDARRLDPDERQGR